MTYQHHLFRSKQSLSSLLLLDSSSLTYHPSSKTSIDFTLVASRSHHCLATFVTRQGHHQLVDQRSKNSTNIAIILINAIYKEFYKCWSSWPAYASTRSKTSSQTYESLIKPLACVSTHSRANAFPIWWLNERSSQSPEGPWVKWKKDGWLDVVKELILKTSTLASFYWSSIGGRFLLIISNLKGGKSRLGLDGSAGLNCQLNG